MLDCKHIFGSLASAIAETIWPTRCVACDLPGTLVCSDCLAQLPFIELGGACPRCGAPHGAVVCTECRPEAGKPLCAADFAFSAARCAVSYDGVAKRMVAAYKDGDEARLAPQIAACMLNTLRGTGAAGAAAGSGAAGSWEPWADALVAVPASPAGLKRRGYDHMVPVAELLAEWTGLPLLAALHSRDAADQRLLGSEQRAANRAESFSLAGGCGPLPAHIVLVDDVLTTGATTSAAAHVLLKAGAAEVRVLCFARVW